MEDRNAFAFFGTEGAASAVLKTYVLPEGFEYPEPEEWFPAPPPSPTVAGPGVAP